MTYRNCQLALLLILLSATAASQEKPVLSTRGELRKCMADGDTIETDRVRIESEIRRLESAQKDLQALAKLHSANRLKVIATRDKAAIDGYNLRVRHIQALTEKLNTRSTDLVAKQNVFNVKVEESNKKCTGMAITLEDHEAVLLERVELATKE